MSRFVTLSKSAPEFKSYLDGSFSSSLVAIPTSTLNVQTESETVTFNVVEQAEVKRPSSAIFYFKLFKVRSFLWIMFPMLIILWRAKVEHVLHDDVVALATSLGLLALYAGLNLRNDHFDHMSGLDRIIPTAGSQAIQKGWIRAVEVKSISNKFILLAASLALPCVAAFPMTAVYILFAFVVSYASHLREKKGMNDWIGGEIAFFVLIGPLLCSGYEFSMSGMFRKDTLFFGLLWGWIVLFSRHLKNLENILIQSQVGWKNLITTWGFDRALQIIRWWWFALVIFFFFYQHAFGGYVWSWYLTLGIGFYSISFLIKTAEAKSPVGSKLRDLRTRGQFLVILVMASFLVEHVWYTIQSLRD